MDILTVGQKIKQIREEKGLSLKDVGGDFVTSAQLSYVENDKSSPSMKLLEYLSEKLEISLEYLLETKKIQAKRYCNLWLQELEVRVESRNDEDIKELHKKIIDLAEKYNLVTVVGDSNLFLSQYYIDNGEYDSALNILEENIFYFTKAENYKKLSRNYIKQGNVYYKKELFEVALQKYKQAQLFYSRTDIIDNTVESDILFNISACYNAMKNNRLALHYAEEACRIDKKTEDKKRYTYSLLKYSSTLMNDREFSAAKDVLTQAKSIISRKKDDKLTAYIENNLGYIYLESGDDEKAFNHLQKALELKEKLQLKELPSTLFGLYMHHYKKGNRKKALEFLDRGIEYSRNNKVRKYEIEGLNYYIDFFLDENDAEKSISKVEELISLLENIKGHNQELIDSYLKLGNIYNNYNMKEEALYAFEKAYKINSKH